MYYYINKIPLYKKNNIHTLICELIAKTLSVLQINNGWDYCYFLHISSR